MSGTKSRPATGPATATSRGPRAGSYRACYRAIWRAVQRSLERADFRVVALVVRSRRVELVVEADSAAALARGMQGLQVSAARQLNRVLRRTGSVFADRYRPAILRTRAAVRAVVCSLVRARRVAWPATALLVVELVPRVHQRVADPDP